LARPEVLLDIVAVAKGVELHDAAPPSVTQHPPEQLQRKLFLVERPLVMRRIGLGS
jgi:hypothetical protein